MYERGVLLFTLSHVSQKKVELKNIEAQLLQPPRKNKPLPLLKPSPKKNHYLLSPIPFKPFEKKLAPASYSPI